MTRESDRSVELRLLIEALCEDSITPEQMARLEEMVLADREAKTFYIKYMHLQSDLRRKFGGVLPEGDFVRRLWIVPPRRPSASWKRRATAAAVVLLLVGLGAAFLRSKGHSPAPASLAVKPYPRVDADNGLAMVVNLDGVAWESDNEPHPAVGDIIAPGRFCFRSGRAILAMLSGVSLVVEGPADLDLVSIDRIFCRRGNLRARVPKGAEGLVVSSPSSAVIDLGTEFGMNIDAGGKSSVKVFEGRAEAVMRSGSGHESIIQQVRVNHAFDLDPQVGRFKPIEGSGDFVTPLDLPTPSLILDPIYRATIMAARPWSYWRFEVLDAGAIPNEVLGRPPLLATGPVALTGKPEDNQAAVFKSGEDCQYLAMKGLWEPTPDPGYAVELWFLPESIDHSSLVSMPAPQDTNNHRFFLEMGSRNRHTVHTPAAVRFLDRWPPGQEGGHNIYSTPHYVPYRWHHLVGQMNRGRMELYLDGEPTYSQSADPVPSTVACQVLLGRLSTVIAKDHELYRLVYCRPFVGRLDEVALYNHPLSIEEVRRHLRLATQQVRDSNRPLTRTADGQGAARHVATSMD
jgi:hypothetical protein